MKATEQYFPVVLFILLYRVVLSFQSVNEILNCDDSNGSYRVALLCDIFLSFNLLKLKLKKLSVFPLAFKGAKNDSVNNQTRYDISYVFFLAYSRTSTNNHLSTATMPSYSDRQPIHSNSVIKTFP